MKSNAAYTRVYISGLYAYYYAKYCYEDAQFSTAERPLHEFFILILHFLISCLCFNYSCHFPYRGVKLFKSSSYLYRDALPYQI